MSDTSQGPGWWQANDGRWYPPETHPHYRPPPPPPNWQPGSPGPYVAQPRQPVVAGPPTNSPATAGGVLGIVGAFLSLIPILGIIIGLLLGVLAIIFSGVGLSRAGQVQVGKGIATVGLVLGILTVIFKLIPGVNLL